MALHKLLYEIEPSVAKSGDTVNLVCGTPLEAEILMDAIAETITRHQAENKSNTNTQQ